PPRGRCRSRLCRILVASTSLPVTNQRLGSRGPDRRTAYLPIKSRAVPGFFEAASGRLRLAREVAQDVVQDAAVPVVLPLLRRIDADDGLELGDLAFRAGRRDLDRPRLAFQVADREGFPAGQAQALGAVALLELQRQHAHPD